MAGLGFILGAGIRALGEHGALKRQQSMMQQESGNRAFEDMVKGNPAAAAQFLGTPEGQKAAKKVWGEQADAMTMMLGAAAKHAQEFAQQNQMAGGQPAPTGQPQQGQQADPIAQRQAQIRRYESLKQQFPEQSKFLDSEIGITTNEIKQLQNQQQHQEHEQDVKIAQGQREESIQANIANQQSMRAIQGMMAQSEMEFRQFIAGLAKEKADTENQKAFDSAKQNLQKQYNTIYNAYTGKGLPSAMNAQQLKPLLDSYNKQAAELAKRAKSAGVDYDPDEFKPLKAEDVPKYPTFGAWAGEKTELSTSDQSGPITATGPKGDKIQWDGKKWVPMK